MNIKTSNGMGIKPKGIAWKPNYGMGIKTSNGMGLKPSNGMGLAQDKNYFKFNEYERKRKYLQMGSCKPGPPRQKNNNNNNNTKKNNANKKDSITARDKPVKNEPVKATAVEEPKATSNFQPRQKWGAAAATVNAAAAFSNVKKKEKSDKYKSNSETPPAPKGPFEDGASVASVKRTMGLFEQLLYV